MNDDDWRGIYCGMPGCLLEGAARHSHNDWNPLGTCPDGCGMPKDCCICKKRPYQTLSEMVREAEANVTEEDLIFPGMTVAEWERIRQWPEDKQS